MAPVLPNLEAHARNLITAARDAAHHIAGRTASSTLTPSTEALRQAGPLVARSILLSRDDSTDTNKVDPHKGVVSPQNINNTFVFVLFGLIGAAFVCAGIWFFFWAKNGGFHFKENDWDDYKSTVLRRKGPNGTILSGATPSTQLGGGSVYKDVDDGMTEYTGGLTQMTGDTGDTGSTLTGITGGASDVTGRERRRQKRERKEREREKKKDRRNREKSGRRVGEDGVLVDEDAEAAAKDHLRAYRHEKAARVGGINKEAESSQWEGSTNRDDSTTAGSELLSNRQSTPTNTPTKSEMKETKNRTGGGIRKVYSTADRNADREERREARRLREEQRKAGSSSGIKRDFSFQRAKVAPHTAASAVSSSVQASTIQEEGESAVGESSGANRYLPPPPGGWASEVGTESEVGTKSYHHVIPGISPSTVSGSASGVGSSVTGTDVRDYADEKRKKRSQRHRRE
ncbi:uncharacterized protein GGS22DRAFT_76339 [Annulohypoxylon maeteangense]|uniref:uncharacterized protein n=1 Tax=Annulohypoxylon maeteangense TaxID=1927788 RepID=UPI0020080D73|nr:uncharacterized protein GGS22DRAFT_76339 [Annulohypoxylon maeteangense]KAI0881144.1 hypothetical protein GGS22DRAFT_76339 [Annulohypoxylon maeteangense]